ncbi:methyltransferase domain-containing protein [Antrihabitans sp. YC3-6]|uniref:Methyltransferase domain-containing protein n=1 Tax=Antrihabitans stalagmiti TaxID=2799499 RepID=A0A934U3Q6_9NOCA|nr:methyltransferase domain-containing protein [Antrihabitans stalagmiti]MBJ8339722.1 methyltransferase domain-containing protein [Antrihabitans stalagmiti]
MTNALDGANHRALQLISPPKLRDAAVLDEGFVDLIGSREAPQPTIAQRAMNSSVVAAIYERLWRPVGVAALGLWKTDEHTKAATDLRLGGNQRVLDVACGPGNFTKFLGSRLDGDGIAVGFDISRPMLVQAARDNRSSHAAYVRGDGRRLPFEDGTFDAVCCYAALYLVPEPFTIVDELIRVLRPGGRIAIMTSCARGPAFLSKVQTVASDRFGVRTFDRNEFTTVFQAAGLTEIEREVHGVAQFVSATKPLR